MGPQDHGPRHAARPQGRPLDSQPRHRRRPGLRHRRPQAVWPSTRRRRAQEHHACQSRQRCDRPRHRRHQGVAGGERLSQPHAHPLLRCLSDLRQPVRRQPAKGGVVEMAVHRSENPDPGRTDPRYRHRRQVRDLLHHQRAGRRRQGRYRDLVGNAGVARDL